MSLGVIHDYCGPSHMIVYVCFTLEADKIAESRECPLSATSGREQMQQHAWAKPDLLNHLVGAG